MSDAELAIGIALVAVLVALAVVVWRLLAMRGELRRATVRHEVAAGLIGGDAVRGVETSLAAACQLLDASVALVVIGAGESDHGVRARHLTNGDLEPLHGIALDDTELGALDLLDTLTDRTPLLLGGADQDPRLARFAAAAGLGVAIIAPLANEGGLRGLVAFGGIRGGLGNTRAADARLVAEHLSDSLAVGAPLHRALDGYVENRHEAAARTLHDPLTNLPTRAIFLEALHQGLEHRDHDRPVALVMIRLGGLLSAIERLGPLAGGAVLGEVGHRLSVLLRRSDVAARVGESEFALLLLDLRDAAEATAVAQRVHDGLAEQVIVGDVALDPSAAIGVRIVEADEVTGMAQVMRDAATALTAAQTAAEGFHIFDVSRDEDDASEMLSELRAAIQEDGLTLHYQPIVDLRDGSVLGAEALVRWFHPERGSVPPMQFLPLAEEAGLAAELGLWVLRHAAAQLHAWQDRFPRTPPLALSVNISEAHLGDQRFSRDVLEAIHIADIDPECVILEFGEDVLQTRLDDADRLLDPLQRAGIQIAVDDVGTGHATLEYLRRMPVDILKIGRPFIAALVDGDPSSSTAYAIVHQGETLKISLVAEGVETALQVTRLRDLGCTMAQGFHLSRPLDAEGMDALLAVGTVELGDLPREAAS